MDEHDLVSAVKALALELGRVPRKYEFTDRVKNGHRYCEKLGGFTVLLQMAGLETYHTSKEKKIDNSIFAKDIEVHLENFKPSPVCDQTPYPTITSISDIHWPFSSQRVIDRFYDFIGSNESEWIILNGDAWDMYSHAKFPRSHNVFTPREEQALARKMNEEFWEKVRTLSPKSKLVQMMGNHDVRPMKRILEEYPEAEDWIAEKLTKLFSFESVQTIMNPREELMLPGDIAVFHGYRGKLGDHRDFTFYNTLNGHTHKGGAVFRQIRGRVLWELNSGFAGDPEAKGLTYRPQKISEWTPGFSRVDAWGPRFIPC